MCAALSRLAPPSQPATTLTQVLAITITYGNAPTALCSESARRLLQLLGPTAAKIPVFVGVECSVPLPYLCSALNDMAVPTEASRAIARVALAEEKGAVRNGHLIE